MRYFYLFKTKFSDEGGGGSTPLRNPTPLDPPLAGVIKHIGIF